jgi:hypothetical protein
MRLIHSDSLMRLWLLRPLCHHSSEPGFGLSASCTPVGDLSMISIATWNVHGIQLRLVVLVQFMVDYAIDILLLQVCRLTAHALHSVASALARHGLQFHYQPNFDGYVQLAAVARWPCRTDCSVFAGSPPC